MIQPVGPILYPEFGLIPSYLKCVFIFGVSALLLYLIQIIMDDYHVVKPAEILYDLQFVRSCMMLVCYDIVTSDFFEQDKPVYLGRDQYSDDYLIAVADMRSDMEKLFFPIERHYDEFCEYISARHITLYEKDCKQVMCDFIGSTYLSQYGDRYDAVAPCN